MSSKRKTPAAKAASEKNPAGASAPGPFKMKIAAALFALVLLGGLWSTGVFKQFFKGPNIPLPRQTADLSLGMSLDDVQSKYPEMNLAELFKEYPGMGLEEILKKNPKLKKKAAEMEKTLRSFNDDPNFGIATLLPQSGLKGASSVDVVFYLPTRKLYFISAMWQGDDAKAIPLEDWAHQYRRWTKTSEGPEPLGNDVQLKEWHFENGPTEMTLRDLKYSDHLQRWEDLRDASNDAAQSAFAKYRLETGS